MPPPRSAHPEAAQAASYLPLKPVDFLILLVLVDRERHGYGILHDIEETTCGEMRLDAGNLYRSLRRLLGQSLVERAARRPAPDAEDERRRYYRLSELGRRVVAAEASRLEKLMRHEKIRRLAAETSP